MAASVYLLLEGMLSVTILQSSARQIVEMLLVAGRFFGAVYVFRGIYYFRQDAEGLLARPGSCVHHNEQEIR